MNMQSRYNGDAKNGKIKIGLGNYSNRDEAIEYASRILQLLNKRKRQEKDQSVNFTT